MSFFISIVTSLEQIAIASTAVSENVNISTNTNELVTQITKVCTYLWNATSKALFFAIFRLILQMRMKL